jgi:hypothetical protein
MATISATADQATSHARATLLDLSTQIVKLINSARAAENRGVDALLHRLGLQRRSSALMPFLWVAAGAFVAGTAVFLVSPASGKRLRERIVSILDGVQPDEVGEAVKKNGADGVRRQA